MRWHHNLERRISCECSENWIVKCVNRDPRNATLSTCWKLYFSSLILSTCVPCPQVDKIKLEKHPPTQGPTTEAQQKHTTRKPRKPADLGRGWVATHSHFSTNVRTRKKRPKPATRRKQNAARTQTERRGTPQEARASKDSNQKKNDLAQQTAQNERFYRKITDLRIGIIGPSTLTRNR